MACLSPMGCLRRPRVIRNRKGSVVPEHSPAPPNLAPAHLRRRLSARLALARASLLWERTWSALWPVTGILCLFLAVAMFDVLPLTPGWLHLAVLLCFASALLFTGWRALRRLAIPDTEQARRKLERDSKLSHRPFAALNDRLATNSRDSAAVMLWEEHRRRLLAQLAHLRVRLPRAGLARVDPFAIRAAVFLV